MSPTKENIRYEDVIQWYQPDDADDDWLRLVKEALMSLTEAERRIMVYYAEIGTYSGVAKMLGVSLPTVRNYVIELKRKIKEYIDDNKTDYTEPYHLLDL